MDRTEPVSTTAPPLRGPVIMNQDWRDLSFIHWAVPPGRVRHLMPPGVEPDTFEGSTYVGLIPFRMVDAGFGRRRRVPWFGTFLETNVRLYSVDATGRRGIVFLSLDADRAAVVAGARVSLGLPYRWARMSHRRRSGPDGDLHDYASRLRRPWRAGPGRITVRVGQPRTATALDEFLSARWGLHTQVLGRTLYVPNTHPAWPIHDAEVLDLHADLSEWGLADLTLRSPDHVAFSPGVHTDFGLPVDARRPRATGATDATDAT